MKPEGDRMKLEPLRICVWSGPRSFSTALMYSFAQRADTRVLDEPLYAHYLRVSGAGHPGRDEVLAALEPDGRRVVEEVILGPCDRPVLFCKQMAHHLIGLDRSFLRRTANAILVRDPAEVLPSLARQIPRPSLADTGLEIQCELLDRLRREGQDPPVLDADELAHHPRGVLGGFCERLGLAFDPAMLRWPAGPKPYDGIWARHWYRSVHGSTGFHTRLERERPAPLPPHLESLLAECRPYYEILIAAGVGRRQPKAAAG